jgi:hypothetical protein
MAVSDSDRETSKDGSGGAAGTPMGPLAPNGPSAPSAGEAGAPEVGGSGAGAAAVEPRRPTLPGPALTPLPRLTDPVPLDAEASRADATAADPAADSAALEIDGVPAGIALEPGAHEDDRGARGGEGGGGRGA